MKTATLLFSILAFVISAIAIVLVCIKRSCDFKFDWNSIIGVLSILVTVLIGFQIVNYFTFEKRVDKKINDLGSKTEQKLISVVENSSSTAVQSMRGTLYTINFQASSVHMQEGTANPDVAIRYLSNCVGYLNDIAPKTRTEFFNKAKEFIENTFDLIDIKNIEYFQGVLLENSTVDKGVSELMLFIEKLKSEKLNNGNKPLK